MKRMPSCVPRRLRLCLILLFLFLLAVSLWLLYRPQGSTVEFVQDGRVLYTFRLNQAEDQQIEVEYEGRRNVVQIADGRVRVLEADCPDQICVQMGWLEGAAPIVCLPNHLVIQFADVDAKQMDAVAR